MCIQDRLEVGHLRTQALFGHRLSFSAGLDLLDLWRRLLRHAVDNVVPSDCREQTIIV